MAPVTRRNTRRVEAMDDGNLTVTSGPRGRVKKKKMTSSKGSKKRQTAPQPRASNTKTKKSARDRLGLKVTEEDSVDDEVVHDSSLPGPAMEDDDDDMHQAENVRHETAINMYTEVLQPNAGLQGGAAISTGLRATFPEARSNVSSSGGATEPVTQQQEQRRTSSTPSSTSSAASVMADISRLRQNRTGQAMMRRDALRISVKELESELTELLQDGSRDDLLAEVKMERLEQELSELRSLDLRIQEALSSDPGQSSVTLSTEMREARLVQESAQCVKRRFLNMVGTGPGNVATRNGGGGIGKLPLKMPRLPVEKFDGSIESWPSWWANFRILHESQQVSTIQKFQVLRQSLEEGSKAQRTIAQFPLEERFYGVAIDELKDRFGKEQPLVDMLVRGTIGLIGEAQKGKLDFISSYDQLQVKLKTLETLGEGVKEQCQCLHTQIERALPADMGQRWEREKIRLTTESGGRIENRLDSLMKFLKTEVMVLEQMNRINDMSMSTVTSGSLVPAAVSLSVSAAKQPTPKSVQTSKKTASGPPLKKKDSREKSGCGICGKEHPTYQCPNAKKMPLQQRTANLRKSGRCYKCLRYGHRFFECNFRTKCITCDGAHQTVLCPGLEGGQKKKPVQKNPNASSSQQQGKAWSKGQNRQQDRKVEFEDGYVPRSQAHRPDRRVEYQSDDDEVTREDLKKIQRTVTGVGVSVLTEVPLQTVQLLIEGPSGAKRVRAILDTGAQKSAVSKNLVQLLGLKKVSSLKLQHNLYGGRRSGTVVHGLYRARLNSLDKKFSMDFNLLDEARIIDDVPTLDKVSAEHLQNLGVVLSDFGEEKPIDILLGNDIFGSILTGELKRVIVSPNQPLVTALRTEFGWVLSGAFGNVEDSEVRFPAVVGALSIAQLFELDTLGIKDPVETKSKRDLHEDAKAYFSKTVERLEDGRYLVEWPWTQERSMLPNNFWVAKARLISATKKLKDSGLYDQYEKVFGEWLSEGIIEEVGAEDLEAAGLHYLPHRGVVKMDSLTTKLRPVFDASCRTNKTHSLNDLLTKGPNMLEMIPDLLMRFRLGQVAAVADIRKAFLQIELKEDQRDVVRFLWWDDDQAELRVFRHKRVVFGVNCSPFLLAAVLEKHLKEAPRAQQEVAMKLLQSLYVDNCVASFESAQQYLHFKNVAVRLLNTAKFDLRMWESSLDPPGLSEVTKVLGITWNKKEDTLAPSISKVKVPEQLTRRVMLAVAHSLFDPIGIFTPVSLIPKQLFREATISGLDWNEPLPEDLAKKFRKWCQEVTVLEKLAIPRPMSTVNPSEGKWSLHIFCDASKSAFATVAFVRVETNSGVTVRFLQSRSRLAPVKETATIPRLELLAGLVGARLGKSIKDALKCDWPTTYWTDSLTVLQWIQSQELWGVFVENRVKEIRQLTSVEDWRHVPGKMNPADVPSRGLSPKKFLASKWLDGPNWLAADPNSWPQESIGSDGSFVGDNGPRNSKEEAFQERKKTVAAAANFVIAQEDGIESDTMETDDELPSSTDEMEDTTNQDIQWFESAETYSQVIRLVAQAIKSQEGQEYSGELTADDMNMAEVQAWKWIQAESKVSDRVKKPLKLELRGGLWCVNTRLSLREDCQEFLWPVYLPSDHLMVKKLIRETHEKLSHAGPGIVIAELRKKAWIQKGKQTANCVIQKCLVCRMHGGKKLTATEAPLPKKRTALGRVFETTGVDYGGPLYTRTGDKVYFALFTCATYRAIHLELVGDASTEAFIQAFRKFRNRRGNPTTVCSDNGTNFRGFDNLMDRIDWGQVKKEFEVDRIKWEFNPPAAPWWGGYWERLIGMVKRILRRILGDRVLGEEELRTALTDAEAVINARPLTFLGEGDDFIPITPNSFLMDVPFVDVVDLDTAEDQGFQKRFQYRQKLREELRQRFRLEYLGSLKSNTTFNAKKHDELKINDLVLIETDSKKRVAWPIGRVIQLFPGRDGVVRLVKVKTQSGDFLRPIQRLVPLGTEMLPEEAQKVQLVTRQVPSQPVEKAAVQEPQIVQADRNVLPIQYQTKSGRISRQPDRLMYLLAGFEIIE